MRTCHFWTFRSLEWAIDSWKDFNFTWQSFHGILLNKWMWQVKVATSVWENAWTNMDFYVSQSLTSKNKCQDCISNFWKPAERTLTCWHLNLAKIKFKIPLKQIHDTWKNERSLSSIACFFPMSFVSSHLSNPETIAASRTKRKAKIAWSSRAQRRRLRQFTRSVGDG